MLVSRMLAATMVAGATGGAAETAPKPAPYGSVIPCDRRDRRPDRSGLPPAAPRRRAGGVLRWFSVR